jgi:hypothetical protein
VKTSEGAVEYSALQVRDTPEPFISGWAFGTHVRELERRSNFTDEGLSTRDVKDEFTGGTGRTLLSRPAVSEITERL